MVRRNRRPEPSREDDERGDRAYRDAPRAENGDDYRPATEYREQKREDGRFLELVTTLGNRVHDAGYETLVAVGAKSGNDGELSRCRVPQRIATLDYRDVEVAVAGRR